MAGIEPLAARVIDDPVLGRVSLDRDSAWFECERSTAARAYLLRAAASGREGVRRAGAIVRRLETRLGEIALAVLEHLLGPPDADAGDDDERAAFLDELALGAAVIDADGTTWLYFGGVGPFWEHTVEVQLADSAEVVSIALVS